MMEKLTLTVSEVGAVMGISRPLAYQLANRADFPVIRVGRRKIIPVEGFKRWLSEQSGMRIERQTNDY